MTEVKPPLDEDRGRGIPSQSSEHPRPSAHVVSLSCILTNRPLLPAWHRLQPHRLHRQVCSTCPTVVSSGKSCTLGGLEKAERASKD